MKVHIGPFKTFIGPYQIAETFLFWEDKYESERIDKLGDFLAHGFSKDKNHNTWFYRLCLWIESKRKRKIKIKIHNYDVWGMDHTLALIIVPMLKMLKENKHGAPLVDDEDVPEELRTDAAPALSQEQIDTGCTDENWFKRWDYILGEMLWAFEQYASEDWETQYYSGETDIQFEKIEGSENYELIRGPNDTFKIDGEGIKKHRERMEKGRNLFFKYYDSLWD